LEVSLLFGNESIARFDAAAVMSELGCHSAMRSFFNAAAQQLGTLNLLPDENSSRTVEFALRLQLEAFSLCGEPIFEVGFQGNAHLTFREIISSDVFAYGKPDENEKPGQPEALLEIFSLVETTISHDVSRISVFLDVSKLEMPPFRQLRFIRMSAAE
jgi:hypothetical protein